MKRESGDWLKLHRKIIESQAFSDPAIFRLWCYLLCRANYRESYFRGVKIEVGQVAFSHRVLAGTLGVSHGALGRYLAKLETWGNIVVKSGRQFSVITICQWETYQSSGGGSWDAGRAQEDTPEDTPETEPAGAQAGREQGRNPGADRGADRHVPKKERIKEGKKGDTPLPPVELPPSVRTERLAAAVAEWLAYKRERREAYKPTGLKAFLAHLSAAVARHGEASVIARLEKAMASGWKGWDHDSRGSPAPAAPADDPRGNFAAANRYLESLHP